MVMCTDVKRSSHTYLKAQILHLRSRTESGPKIIIRKSGDLNRCNTSGSFHLNCFISTSSGQPRDFRMPVTSKYWSTMSCKLLITAIRTSQIPQLNIAIFRNSSKAMMEMRAELNITDTFGVTEMEY